VLHWITAVLILSMIPLGVVTANDWGGSAQDSLYDLVCKDRILMRMITD
jgi:cytochrome b561